MQPWSIGEVNITLTALETPDQILADPTEVKEARTVGYRVASSIHQYLST